MTFLSSIWKYLVCIVGGAVIGGATMAGCDRWPPAPVPAPTPVLVLTVEPATGEPGQPFKVTADTKGETVEWLIDPGLKASYPADAEKYVWVWTNTPGTYTVGAYTAIGGKQTKTVKVKVRVGDPGPQPPDPKPPDPGPKPAPEPSDPLWPSLKSAFIADGSDSVKAKALAAVYRQALPKMSNYKACSEFLAVTHTVADSVVGKGAMPATRRVLANELNKYLPTTDAPLDSAMQAKITEQFNRAAGLLDSLGGLK